MHALLSNVRTLWTNQVRDFCAYSKVYERLYAIMQRERLRGPIIAVGGWPIGWWGMYACRVCLCMCACACMCVDMRACVCISCVHVCMRVHMCVSVFTRVCMYAVMCMRVRMYVSVCMRVLCAWMCECS